MLLKNVKLVTPHVSNEDVVTQETLMPAAMPNVKADALQTVLLDPLAATGHVIASPAAAGQVPASAPETACLRALPAWGPWHQSAQPFRVSSLLHTSCAPCPAG